MTISGTQGNLFVQSGGAWKYPNDIKIFQGNAWTPVSDVYVMTGGQWEHVWPSGPISPTYAQITLLNKEYWIEDHDNQYSLGSTWYHKNILTPRFYVHLPNSLSESMYGSSSYWDASKWRYERDTYTRFIGFNPGKTLYAYRDWSNNTDIEYVTYNWSDQNLGGSSLTTAQQEIGRIFDSLSNPSRGDTINNSVYNGSTFLIRLDVLKYLFPNDKIKVSVWGQWQTGSILNGSTYSDGAYWGGPAVNEPQTVAGTDPVYVKTLLSQNGQPNWDGPTYGGLQVTYYQKQQTLMSDAKTVSSSYALKKGSDVNGKRNIVYDTQPSIGDFITTFVYDCSNNSYSYENTPPSTPSFSSYYARTNTSTDLNPAIYGGEWQSHGGKGSDHIPSATYDINGGTDGYWISVGNSLTSTYTQYPGDWS
jgi:hypothetical protein